MQFPTSGLDLSQFTSKEAESSRPPVYDLFATADHLGERDSSGHYVAHRLGDEWHTFNDAQVTRTTPEELQGPSTYVLFYRLRESSS